ncbi:MAG: STAS domain-containing protein [Spirochaetes bacterium]|nr:STAS domain-containing protein [Spirochaetota bacterium]
MNIELTYNNDTINITIMGNIDTLISTELNTTIQEIIDNTEIKNAVFDLKGVNNINSAGIGKLLKLYKHFENIGGSFKIIHASSKLKSLFTNINLDKIISISE